VIVDDKKPVMRVLIVDDKASIRGLIRTVAAMKGYETLEAEDGLEALEIARRFGCDLIITDQEMPRMKGLELIERLTSEGYPALYLLVSGFNISDPQAAGIPTLAKPFTVNDLLRTLEKLTREQTIPELERAWRAAKRKWEEAIAEMDQLTREVPSNISHLDGSPILEKAEQKQKAAYEKYLAAHRKFIAALKK
jgi:two-component system, chemotaxis family, chemotaxis protein CheY